MSQQLSDVVAVTDMDGFTVNKKSTVRDWAYWELGDITAQSFFFDLGIRWGDLTSKDRTSCNYVRSHILKLPFGVPWGTKAFKISALEAIIERFYHGIKIDKSSTIAYKGGHYERDLLANLDIPSMNLECFAWLSQG